MVLSTSNIRNMFRNRLKTNPEADTLEIIGASFIADEAYIFGTPNKEYIKREIEWYESQSLNVNDLPNTPKIWKAIATKDGYINSNYGWCIFSKENYSQYSNVVKELQANPKSRRAIMIYNRPSMHIDATRDDMNDFICTNAVQYYIRYDKLHCVVQMRSNDAVFGYKNDYAWQKYVLEKLAKDLNKPVGSIVWQVANLHIYKRHYYLIGEYYANN